MKNLDLMDDLRASPAEEPESSRGGTEGMLPGSGDGTGAQSQPGTSVRFPEGVNSRTWTHGEFSQQHGGGQTCC